MASILEQNLLLWNTYRQQHALLNNCTLQDIDNQLTSVSATDVQDNKIANLVEGSNSPGMSSSLENINSTVTAATGLLSNYYSTTAASTAAAAVSAAGGQLSRYLTPPPCDPRLMTDVGSLIAAFNLDNFTASDNNSTSSDMLDNMAEVTDQLQETNRFFIRRPHEMLHPYEINPSFLPIVITHTLTFLIGVIGNCVVIATWSMHGKLRSPTAVFLVSLAIADLILLLVVVPMETLEYFLITWAGLSPICKMIAYVEVISGMSTVLNLVGVSIERFLVIVYPMRARSWCTMSSTRKGLTIIWSFAFILSTPVLLTRHTTQITYYNATTSLTLYYCFDIENNLTFIVAIYQLLVMFILPALFMVLCYYVVIQQLWVSTRSVNAMTRAENRVNQHAPIIRSSGCQQSDSAGVHLTNANSTSSNSHANFSVTNNSNSRFRYFGGTKLWQNAKRIKKRFSRLDIVPEPDPKPRQLQNDSDTELEINKNGNNGNCCKMNLQNLTNDLEESDTSGTIASTPMTIYNCLCYFCGGGGGSGLFCTHHSQTKSSNCFGCCCNRHKQNRRQQQHKHKKNNRKNQNNRNAISGDEISECTMSTSYPMTSIVSVTQQQQYQLQQLYSSPAGSPRASLNNANNVGSYHHHNNNANDLPESPCRLSSLDNANAGLDNETDDDNQHIYVISSSPTNIEDENVGEPVIAGATGSSLQQPKPQRQSSSISVPSTCVAHQMYSRTLANNVLEITKSRIQVIKMLVLIVALFLLCWGPRLIMNVYIKMGLPTYSSLSYNTRITCYLLSFVHSALNPFVYGFMSSNFRAMVCSSFSGRNKKPDVTAASIANNNNNNNTTNTNTATTTTTTTRATDASKRLQNF